MIIKYILILLISFNIDPLIYELINVTIFIGILICTIFSIIQSLRGIEADLPFISDAVKIQI